MKRVDVSVEQSKTSTHWANCKLYFAFNINYIRLDPEIYRIPTKQTARTRGPCCYKLLPQRSATNEGMHSLLQNPNHEQACKKLSKFSDTEYCIAPVRFTRILYAQLLRQPLDFVPQGLPKLPDDKPNMSAGATAPQKVPIPATGPTRKEMELGYKLVCGFEILYTEKKRAMERREKTKQQQKKMREQREAKGGRSMVETMEEEEDQFVDPSQAIDDIFGTDNQPWNAWSPATNIKLSSESWLNISPDEVDDLISKKQREFQEYEDARAKKKNKKADGKDKEGSDSEEDPLEAMVNEVKKFVSKMSDYSGIGEDEDVDMEGTEKSEKGSENKKEDFDMDIKKFVEIMYGGKFNPQDGSGSESDEGDEFYGMGTDSEEDNEKDGEMKNVMHMMDEELKGTSVGKSFEKLKASVEGDANTPVDIDLNLVENFLKSFEAQHGTAGPVSSVLSSMKGHK